MRFQNLVITSSLTSSSLGWRLPARKIFRLNMEYIIYTIYGAIKPYLFAGTIRTDLYFLAIDKSLYLALFVSRLWYRCGAPILWKRVELKKSNI